MKSNRRQFLATTGCGIPGACLLSSRPASALGKTKEEARFLLSEQGCGRATGYAEANKIVTFGDHTHVTWLDSPAEGFRVRVRTLNRMTGEWSPTSTIGEGYDNHGGPALTVDREGYLHIVYFPHHHAFRYRRSKRPNDAAATRPSTTRTTTDLASFKIDPPGIQHKPKNKTWKRNQLTYC